MYDCIQQKDRKRNKEKSEREIENKLPLSLSARGILICSYILLSFSLKARQRQEKVGIWFLFFCTALQYHFSTKSGVFFFPSHYHITTYPQPKAK